MGIRINTIRVPNVDHLVDPSGDFGRRSLRAGELTATFFGRTIGIQYLPNEQTFPLTRKAALAELQDLALLNRSPGVIDEI